MVQEISTTEVLQVASAIAYIFDKGKVPAVAPPRYRQALEDICDARVDRTSERKKKYDSGMKVLRPVLDSPGCPQAVGRALMLLANLEMLAKLGPFPLPVPKFHYHYEHMYRAKGGETIADAAKMYGYDNPGPLCYGFYDYPGNMRLRAGDTIFVPYHPKTLERIEGKLSAGIKVTKDAIEGLKGKVDPDKEELEHTLYQLELIAMALTLVVSAQYNLAKASATAMSAAGAGARKLMSSGVARELAHAGCEEAVIKGYETAALVAEKKHVGCGVSNQFLHLAIVQLKGLFSPGHWSPLLGYLGSKCPLLNRIWCFKEIKQDKDMQGEMLEVFFKGPEAIAEKRLERVRSEMDLMVFDLELKLADLKSQKASDMYRKKW